MGDVKKIWIMYIMRHSGGKVYGEIEIFPMDPYPYYISIRSKPFKNLSEDVKLLVLQNICFFRRSF